MEGELRLDLRAYRAMVRAALGREVWLLRGLGLLVVAYAVLALVLGVSPIWSVLYLLIGAGAVGYSELATRLGWRQLRGLVDQPWRYQIAHDGVGVHTPATDERLRWELIARATRSPGAWALKTTTRQRLAIPRAAFTADDAARIDQRLAAFRRSRRAGGHASAADGATGSKPARRSGSSSADPPHQRAGAL